MSLTSPNRGLVWGPEGAQITRGFSFVFTCSTSSHYPGGVFHLIFSGSNLTNTEPAVNQSASFSFPVAEYEQQGNYSCVYEVTLSSRRFTSTQTAPISIVIKMAVRVGNDSEDNDYEDDEADYVNVDPMDTTQKLKEEEETNDYVEQESDEDHDYKEEGPRANIKAKNVCFSVEENREPVEDDEDYENVTKPFSEETLDIYGEQDIYQNF
ncbi:hypothetical protein PFLUV_G00182920 [Perca fluviatilis]|uniref:Immunoglobulin-like beta-sandwich domain-containing protein n=1 Tax=Perca fluviatilis TaxID=8168 RepID=A0A6A5EWJ6_PERFL|nr:hypothetical protein PFLUV_G00182920 [Perca fluviatilis]